MDAKKTILVADDIRLNRELFRSALQEEYNIIDARNGEEAVRIMETKPIDLLILDIVMPVMDGIDVLRYRSAHRDMQNIPVIVVTAVEDSDMEIQVLELGANDVVRKPFDVGVLRRRLENVISSCNAAVLSKENQMLKRLQHLEGKNKEYVKLFHSLLNHIPGGVALFEIRKGQIRIIFANEGVSRMFGYSQQEYVGVVEEDALVGVHPEDKEIVLRAAEKAVSSNQELEVTFRNQCNNGEYIWVKLTASIMEREEDRVVGYGVYSDIDRLKLMAEKDSLTGLYNRQMFEGLVEMELGKESADGLALFMIDLDNFKQINDRFGHLYGDAVLAEVAKRIASVFRTEDLVARIGGDEFCVLVTSPVSEQLAEERAGMLLAQMYLCFEKKEEQVCVSASIGIAFVKPECRYKELFREADEAQYYAKQHGKNCCLISGPVEQKLYRSDIKEPIVIRLE